MKLIFLLTVYLAGFATAIFILAPLPGDESRESWDDFAPSFNALMHKSVGFLKHLIKEGARQVAKFIEKKLDERDFQIET